MEKFNIYVVGAVLAFVVAILSIFLLPFFIMNLSLYTTIVLAGLVGWGVWLTDNRIQKFYFSLRDFGLSFIFVVLFGTLLIGFHLSALVAVTIAAVLALVIGVVKEFINVKNGGEFSLRNLLDGFVGIVLGFFVML